MDEEPTAQHQEMGVLVIEVGFHLNQLLDLAEDLDAAFFQVALQRAQVFDELVNAPV